MRILIAAIGSTGDTFPFIALGYHLRREGYDVHFAATEFFKEPIEAAGLQLINTPPIWGADEYAAFLSELNEFRSGVSQIRHIYKALNSDFTDYVEILEQEITAGTELLIASYLFPFIGALAQKHDIPYVSCALSHFLVPTKQAPPRFIAKPSFLPKRIQYLWNFYAWKLTERLLEQATNSIIRKGLKENGLEVHNRFIFNPAELTLLAIPEIFLEHSIDDKRTQVVGSLRWQSPCDESTLHRIKAFAGQDKVPVINFGSITFKNSDIIMERFCSSWPRGKKAIIQSGWAGLKIKDQRPDILLIGAISHDALLKHASVFIHHGGAGTTASGLYNGIPQVIIPHIADQFFWAKEVIRLKIGLSIHKRTWPEELHAAVLEIERKDIFRKNATHYKNQISKDSPRSAVSKIQEFIEKTRNSL